MALIQEETAARLTRLEGYFSTMSPIDYVGCDGADPEYGPWRAWCEDQVESVNGEFALFAWWNFCAALSAFVAPEGDRYPDYIVNDLNDGRLSSSAHDRLAAEIVGSLREIESNIGHALTLKRRHREDDFWPKGTTRVGPIRRASAFALWCWDQAMLALYNKDTASAAAAVAYAVDSTRMAEDYVQEVRDGPHGPERRAKSMLGRNGAAAKLAKDPKQTEKKFVRDCWMAWQKNPSNYKTKAAFARDMLTKCKHVIDQRTIESWCRKWEESQ